MKKLHSKFRKVFSIGVFGMGFYGIMSAQCVASYTYSASNSSISASCTSVGTNSTTAYNWTLNSNIGGAATSTLNPAVFNSLYNGTYFLYLSLIDSFGCNSTSTTQTITISGGANAPLCSSSFTDSLGVAGAVVFTNTSPVDPYNNNHYTLDFGDGTQSNNPSVSHTYYYDSTYVVTLYILNYSSGCSSSYSDTLVITNAHPVPTCTAAFTYTTGAAGLVNFSGSYTGTSSGVMYQWNFGNGSTNNGTNPSYTYPYNGTYNVTLNIADSLGGCSDAVSQTLIITNASTPPCTPTVTFFMHQDSANPQPGVWEVSTYYSSQVANAMWQWGDGTSSIGLSTTHNYAFAGQYNICVTVYSNCGDSSTVCQNDSLYRNNQSNSPNSVISVTVLNENQTGVKNVELIPAKISFFPNPVKDILNIEIAKDNYEVTLSEISGRMIWHGILIGKASIDMKNETKGLYFLKLTNQIEAKVLKIVKD